MHYSIHIMYPVAQCNTEVRVVDLGKVDHAALDALLRPLLDGDDYEHVTVLWRGRRADMFVGENSTDNLPVNKAATSIYRAATLARSPGINAECLPRIHGTAVLFEEIIWR
jgi:hypothetical protein